NFFFEDVDADIVELVRAAADVCHDLGAELREIALPGAETAVDSATTIIRAEAFAIHRQRLAEQPERFGDDVRRRLELGEAITASPALVVTPSATAPARRRSSGRTTPRRSSVSASTRRKVPSTRRLPVTSGTRASPKSHT